MKLIVCTIFVALAMLSGCVGVEPLPPYSLEDTELLGRWEISERSGGYPISYSGPLCCEFLTFSDDDDSLDLLGLALREVDSMSTPGVLDVQSSANRFTITYDNEVFSRSFDVQDDVLTLGYEQDGQWFESTWNRIP